MEEINKKELFKLFVIKLFIVLLLLITTFIVFYKIVKHNEQTTSPVEGIKIDSLSNDNKLIINDIVHSESLKYEKIKEVESLNNDSTISLFYELIRK